MSFRRLQAKKKSLGTYPPTYLRLYAREKEKERNRIGKKEIELEINKKNYREGQNKKESIFVL